jgi:hypothetical protein
MRKLARSHSTTELLPLDFMSINEAVPRGQTWRLRGRRGRVPLIRNSRDEWGTRPSFGGPRAPLPSFAWLGPFDFAQGRLAGRPSPHEL